MTLKVCARRQGREPSGETGTASSWTPYYLGLAFAGPHTAVRAESHLVSAWRCVNYAPGKEDWGRKQDESESMNLSSNFLCLTDYRQS